MEYDLIVVGGGAGGIAAARAGRRLGRRTLLVQDGPIGGDCTFSGCIPSKTLVECASRGVPFAEAITRLSYTVELIAEKENAEALGREQIEVLEGRARFVDPRTLVVGKSAVSAKRIVLATGSLPAVPPIPGLADTRYLTNETIFK